MKLANQNYGGLVVEKINSDTRTATFSNEFYQYTFYRLKNNESLQLSGSFYTIIVPLTDAAHLEIDDQNTISGTAQYFLGDTKDVKIKATSDEALFVVGTRALNESITPSPSQVINIENCKSVSKPWGYELWLTGEQTKVFAFKKILIRAGNKTSLQYHNEKRETNFVFSGKANLYFAKDSEQEPETFTSSDIEGKLIEGPVVVDVINRKIHRLEAVTDILLFEISTPQLDDVIRISDDTRRGNGRIASEHHGSAR